MAPKNFVATERNIGLWWQEQIREGRKKRLVEERDNLLARKQVSFFTSVSEIRIALHVNRMCSNKSAPLLQKLEPIFSTNRDRHNSFMFQGG